MPFYKALEMLMLTSSTMVKRKCWNDQHYLIKVYDKYNCSYRIDIVAVTSEHGKICTPYFPRPDDLTAEDWMIIAD